MKNKLKVQKKVLFTFFTFILPFSSLFSHIFSYDMKHCTRNLTYLYLYIYIYISIAFNNSNTSWTLLLHLHRIFLNFTYFWTIVNSMSKGLTMAEPEGNFTAYGMLDQSLYYTAMAGLAFFLRSPKLWHDLKLGRQHCTDPNGLSFSAQTSPFGVLSLLHTEFVPDT